MTRELKILTTDKLIEHKITSVRIFTNKYSKKIKKQEFHCPEVAKFIVETEHNIYAYIINAPVVISDEKGNIQMYSSTTYEDICDIKPLADKGIIKRAKYIVGMLTEKQKLGLSVDEIIEKHKAKLILSREKLKTIKLSYEHGGGF